MQRINRRVFCGTCLAIGGAAVAKNGLPTPGLTPAQSRFVVGSVFSVTDTTLYAITPDGVRTVLLSPGVRVWREFDGLPPSSLQAGDRLFIRLDPGPAGAYAATKIYANLVNYYGLVAGVNANGLAFLRSTNQKEPADPLVDVTYSSNLSYVSVDGIQVDVGQIHQGHFIQVIGMRPVGGAVHATRIFAWNL
ncbi:MAG: hypothetical protein ACREFO_14385 [Acetobacteraceae bacterium]